MNNSTTTIPSSLVPLDGPVSKLLTMHRIISLTKRKGEHKSVNVETNRYLVVWKGSQWKWSRPASRAYVIALCGKVLLLEQVLQVIIQI
jgi:hypothetical protein